MRLDQANVVLRPRSPSSVADLSIRYVFDLAPRWITRLAAGVLLPGWLGLLLLVYLAGVEWWLIWWLAAGYVTLAQGLFTVAFGRLLFERRPDPRSVRQAYRQRLAPHLWGAIWTRLLVALGIPLLGLGFYWWARYAFLHEAILLEGMNGGHAARRAATLAKNSSSDVVSLLFLLSCFHLGAAIGVEILCRGVVEWLLMLPPLTEPAEEAGGSPFALLGFLAATPFAAAYRFLMYIDGRTKHDGWDVQVLFMRIEAHNQERS